MLQELSKRLQRGRAEPQVSPISCGRTSAPGLIRAASQILPLACPLNRGAHRGPGSRRGVCGPLAPIRGHSSPHHPTAAVPRAEFHSASLGLGFLNCRVRTVVFPTLSTCWEAASSYPSQYLACGQLWLNTQSCVSLLPSQRLESWQGRQSTRKAKHRNLLNDQVSNVRAPRRLGAGVARASSMASLLESPSRPSLCPCCWCLGLGAPESSCSVDEPYIPP